MSHYTGQMTFFTRIFSEANNQELFPEIYKLMGLSLVVMVGNAKAERAFPVLNRIKTSARAKLNIEQLDRLIRLRYAEIPVEEFQFRRAAEAKFVFNTDVEKARVYINVYILIKEEVMPKLKLIYCL